MRAVFADSNYWIALLHPKDDLHNAAVSASEKLGDQVRLVTSELVLVEVLNYFSGKGASLRKHTVDLIRQMRRNPNVLILPLRSEQFQESMQLYSERDDKEWSLTDCASCLIIKEHGITEALTRDRHFAQFECKPLLARGL